MQPIFLSSGMGAAPIPDDVKFTHDDKKNNVVAAKCERALKRMLKLQDLGNQWALKIK